MTGRRIVTAALSIVLLVACGPSGLSKEEYVERANRICKEANERSAELERPRSPEELGPFIEEARRITENTIDRLRRLEPPEEDRARIERMLSNLEKATTYFDDIKAAAEDEDLARFEELARRVGEAAGEAERIADDYGLDQCRSEPVVPGE
jgi:hypothetical protein